MNLFEDDFTYKKYEKISNHTARRTFATLAYLNSDLQIRDIMHSLDTRKVNIYEICSSSKTN